MRNLMSPLIGLAVAIAMASPAAADWTIDNGGSDSYQTTGVTEDGRVTIMIGCSGGGRISMQLNTDIPYINDNAYTVPISVTIDGRLQPIFNGDLMPDRELVLVSGSGTLPTIVSAIASSKSTIDVQFDKWKYRFSAKGSTAAMHYLQEKCQ